MSDRLEKAMSKLMDMLSDSEQLQDDLAKRRRGSKRLLLIEGARWQGIRDALTALEAINSVSEGDMTTHEWYEKYGPLASDAPLSIQGYGREVWAREQRARKGICDDG